MYIACRSIERAQHAVDDIVNKTGVSRSQLPILQLDLASLKSIRSFASSFKQSKHLIYETRLTFLAVDDLLELEEGSVCYCSLVGPGEQ